ncbi:MAG: hypothetical protein ABSH38_09575 [Verrucomicrobiota bacterium]|jgi:hypothetical protein
MKKARRGLAAFCLGVFLALYAMVAIPALHALAHEGARDAGHECAVTLFAHGQVHSASTAVELRQPAPLILSGDPQPAAIFVSADIRLLPSRGPPAGSLFI